jgi:serine/threonine-protein kinase
VALADDLDRFLRVEPIHARPISAIERTSKWVRRRKAIALASATIMLLSFFGVASILYAERETARLRAAVDNDLSELNELEAGGQWERAETTLNRAEARLDVASEPDLHKRVSEARRDLNLASSLDVIRLSRATAGSLVYYRARADEAYEKVFRESVGLTVGTPIDRAQSRINTSSVTKALVGALEDWAICAVDSQRRSWLLELASRCDPDSSGWWPSVCRLECWDDVDLLAELAANPPKGGPSMSAMLAVGERLRVLRKDVAASTLLRQVQQDHPGEFWPNLMLGEALNYSDAPEAEHFFRAALAARPEAAVAYNSVGDSLAIQRKYASAIEYYRKALAIEPNYARAQGNLAQALESLGQYDDAIQAADRTLRLDSNYAWAHFAMAGALKSLGRFDEALSHYAIIYRDVPWAPNVLQEYVGTLVQVGRSEEARALWKRSLDDNPTSFEAWTGYPELCLLLGDKAEYLRVRTMVMKQFGTSQDLRIAEPLTRMCLLVPFAPDETDQSQRSAQVADRALAAELDVTVWQHEYYQFLKGLTDYRGGHVDSAITVLSGLKVLGPCPKLVSAMALKDKGKDAEALAMLADAVDGFDWRPTSAGSRDTWIYHILRREAEAKIIPNISALIDGSRQPIDDNERLVLIANCQFNGHHVRCARIFTDIVNAEPMVFQTRTFSPGFVLACAESALAARNVDDRIDIGSTNSETNRTALLLRACQWLEHEQSVLLQRKRTLTSDGRGWITQQLTAWKRDPGLAPMRDPQFLQVLSPEEHDPCKTLWTSVDVSVDALQGVGPREQDRVGRERYRLDHRKSPTGAE